MLSYCLKCGEKTNWRVVKTKNRRIMVSSNCSVCGSKKLKFIKKQESKGLLGSTFGKIPILEPLLI